MKKFIIAALSILVGSFGYTIVDTALETRVAVLESEVQELREDVSNYHHIPTTRPNEYKTTIKVEIPSYNPPTAGDASPMGTTKPSSTNPDNSIYVGKQLSKDANSRSKFLIYVNKDGSARYISPESYDDYLHPSATTKNQSYTTFPNYTQEANTRVSNIPIGEYWIDVSESSAVISNIDEKNFYDKDYSLVSSGARDVYITLNCVGKIDPVFSDSEIVFSAKFKASTVSYQLTQDSEYSKINPDGSFEYTAIYSCPASIYMNSNLSYIIDSVSISPR